ncbi:MAG: YebC/PmpR family DNA-binding transcriptional regulator [Phycisphaerae bacterium]|nr:YebC/PmpR family DNA-binding transcriptional regulator [Phycisphaerae bacterium]
MAGHSAWKNIKHRKAAVDAKRGKIWSKLSRAIIVAAKSGGGDPKFNASLRLAIEDAKAANMPRDTIEKAVKKGSGDLDGESYEAVRYEGYGPGGVAFVVECLTGNVNRTAPEIRTLFDKGGGKLGVPGSVTHGFSQQGVVLVPGDSVGEDRMLELALEAGADDVRSDSDGHQVTCAPTSLAQVKESLVAAGLRVESAELSYVPLMATPVDATVGAQVQRLVDALEEHDDVQKVHTNADFQE